MRGCVALAEALGCGGASARGGGGGGDDDESWARVAAAAVEPFARAHKFHRRPEAPRAADGRSASEAAAAAARYPDVACPPLPPPYARARSPAGDEVAAALACADYGIEELE